MTPGAAGPGMDPEVRVSPGWLALREPADAAARAADLVGLAADRLPRGVPVTVHDLGCGTGSMGRWLAPRLPGPQHWVMYDRDTDLLAHAMAGMPAEAAGGAPVTVETRRRDITRLDPADLAGAGLVTASALLDMFTGEELARFVASCAGAGCPSLLTISVTGRVELDPPDPLDARVRAAFNDHQRRTTAGRRLLGPDAVDAAAAEFRRLGADVLVRPSPWRLGPAEAALCAEWFTGWVGAACEQDHALAAATARYTPRRLAEAAAGQLSVTVDHLDLLAVPR
jgi:hypothetical protein